MNVEDFDWAGSSCKGNPPVQEPPYLLFYAPMNESHYDRSLRMIREVRRACMACSMCELGRKAGVKGRFERDPHVFSNQNPTRFLVYGQNPGWDELEKCEPFVGQAGQTFDNEIAVHGLTRENFYIANVVRCFTHENAKPLPKHVERCSPFLQMEINLIRPLLVITLGALAFENFCPETKYSDGLGTITESKKFEVPVFAIYHPSPRNLSDKSRAAAFKHQVKLMCKLVVALAIEEAARIEGLQQG